MFVNNGTPIIIPYRSKKSAAQLQRQRIERQRKIQCQRRLNILIKQTKQKIVFSAVLLKRSKHLKSWRQYVYVQLFRRKLIMTQNMIGTFQIKKDKIIATEWILLTSIQSCVPPVQEKNDPKDLFLFSFYGDDKNQVKNNFRFACQTKEERNNWIKIIKDHAPNCKK